MQKINNVSYSCKHKRPDMLHFERIEREFDSQKANPIGSKARLQDFYMNIQTKVDG